MGVILSNRFIFNTSYKPRQTGVTFKPDFTVKVNPIMSDLVFGWEKLHIIEALDNCRAKKSAPRKSLRLLILEKNVGLPTIYANKLLRVTYPLLTKPRNMLLGRFILKTRIMLLIKRRSCVRYKQLAKPLASKITSIGMRAVSRRLSDIFSNTYFQFINVKRSMLNSAKSVFPVRTISFGLSNEYKQDVKQIKKVFSLESLKKKISSIPLLSDVWKYLKGGVNVKYISLISKLNVEELNVNVSIFGFVKIPGYATGSNSYCKIDIFCSGSFEFFVIPSFGLNRVTIVDPYLNKIYLVDLGEIGSVYLTIKSSISEISIGTAIYHVSKNLSLNSCTHHFKLFTPHNVLKYNDVHRRNRVARVKAENSIKLKINSDLADYARCSTIPIFWSNVWLSKSELYSIKDKSPAIQNIKYLAKRLYLKNEKRDRILFRQESRSFKWRFAIKRWYFIHSKWKRSIAFKIILKKALIGYRKIQKNFLFIKLFHVHVFKAFGITIDQLIINWYSIRRGYGFSNNISILTKFSISLQLKLDNLVLMLGLSPMRPLASELVKCGGFRINGVTITNINYLMSINDVLQIDLNIANLVKRLCAENNPINIKTKLNYIGFFQPLWSTMSFIMIRWPYSYEVTEESIITERWLRYYIRYYPIKLSKMKSPKIKWLRY